VVPYTYKEKNLVNAVQWAVGLELLLLIDDPWRIYLTTDHPNGAAFWRYPEIIQLLMNADFRREHLKKLAPKALKRIVLPALNREYTLYEIAIITSAAQRGPLACRRKGSSASAPTRTWPSSTTRTARTTPACSPIRAMSSRAARVVIEEGEIRKTVEGRGFLVRPSYDEKIEEYIRPLFQQYYTMSFDNYPVEMERLEQPDIRPCKQPT